MIFKALNLPREIIQMILLKELTIEDLNKLRKVSKDDKSAVDEFARHELLRIRTKGSSILIDFLATTQKQVTSDNAWRILREFNKSYFSFPSNMSIEESCKKLQDEADQATLALKDALVLQSPQAFADLALQQTAKNIRNWFSNPTNQALLGDVTELNLNHRGLALVPDELRFLSNLTSLDLSNNEIRTIHAKAFANLRNLQRLHLNQNQLTEIGPEIFANLPNLQHLYLFKTRITAIHPQTFASLPNLRILALSQNQISAINLETFANLRNLQWLFLNQNQLTEINRETFANLQNLQILSLRNNPISAAGSIDHAYLGLGEEVTLFF